jgi:hypothetical protein
MRLLDCGGEYIAISVRKYLPHTTVYLESRPRMDSPAGRGLTNRTALSLSKPSFSLVKSIPPTLPLSTRQDRSGLPRLLRVSALLVLGALFLSLLFDPALRSFSRDDVRKVVTFAEESSNDVRTQAFWTEPSHIQFYAPRAWRSAFRGQGNSDAALRRHLCRFAEDLCREKCMESPSTRCFRQP